MYAPSEKEEEISIDFSKIKQKFKSVFKSNVKSKEEHKKTGASPLFFYVCAGCIIL